MANHFLVSVDLDKDLKIGFNAETATESRSTLRGLDLRTISFLNEVHIRVTPQNYVLALSFVQQNFNHLTTFCDVTNLTKITDVIALLDIGVAKAFVSQSQFKSIVTNRILEDIERLVVALDHAVDNCDLACKTPQTEKGTNVVIDSVFVAIQTHNMDQQWLLDDVQKTSQLCQSGHCQYVTLLDHSIDSYVRTLQAGHVPIIPSSFLTMDPDNHPHLIPVHSLIVAALHSDRADGLFPTVVADERGTCLGLVYSNEKSIESALRLGKGVYHSRSRNGLWIKGLESGDTQQLISVGLDCDADTLRFTVRQDGDGFCHLKTSTCFGPYHGLSRLQRTLQARKASSPLGSYTTRLFEEPKLLQAKIMEEASELCQATNNDEIAAEAADLIYFTLTKCIAAGVNLEDIEHNLDRKSKKVTRRNGNAKKRWAEAVESNYSSDNPAENLNEVSTEHVVAASVPRMSHKPVHTVQEKIQMRRYSTVGIDPELLNELLQRPSQRSNNEIMKVVGHIVEDVRNGGDSSVLKYTHKFEKATSLTSPIIRSPYPADLMKLNLETLEAIDLSFENIRHFHEAQKEQNPLQVETMPGVVCSRFTRPIDRVGLYVPGGTAVLPSTAMMLGVPAMVAGCRKIIFASPPRNDGTISPEIVYIAHKVGAECIILAGGAQAIAAMAYGTESIAKVDKILGPGNQYVTAGKMIVNNDTMAGVSIDMPAGPSEVLVIADRSATPSFVASDLLSQAEHGTDSQVILIAVDLDDKHLSAIEEELNNQAKTLPRIDIVRGAIEHSVTLMVKDITEAIALSNRYAPEHLILQVENAEALVEFVQNAGSVFIGHWAPESVGDYSAGVNHSLPTHGYAKQYSGVNLSSFTKYITCSNLSVEGLKNIGGAVMQFAKVEELEAHSRAVSIRLETLLAREKGFSYPVT